MSLPSLERSPRTNYKQLADNAYFVPQPRHRWELQPRTAHVKREKNRLANEAFRSLIEVELNKAGLKPTSVVS